MKGMVITMNKEHTEFVADALKKLVKINYIKPGEVPNIDLYMDQVTTFMDEHLRDSKRHEDDKILTKTMINNYAKNNLLPPPVKKKYSKDHLYILAFIYYFKSILSISDIQKLLNPLTDNFFNTDEAPNMDSIYKEVYNMCKSQITELSKDVINKANLAGASYDKLEDKDEKDFLHLFSLICMLSFDVYVKKYMIETLIDEYTNSDDSSTQDKDSSKSKSKSKNKHEDK